MGRFLGVLPLIDLGNDLLQDELKLIEMKTIIIKILRQDSCQNVSPGIGTTAVSFAVSSDWYTSSGSCSGFQSKGAFVRQVTLLFFAELGLVPI